MGGDVFSSSQGFEIDQLKRALRRLYPKLPGALRYRFESTLNHLDQAFLLFGIDREMASFRAITAEEEAATALMKCIHMRRYEYAEKFNPRNHQHKAAVMACVMAVGSSLQPIIKEIQLIFKFSSPRIDIKLPLSNFGVIGGENYAIQFTEPLDLLHTREGVVETDLFNDALRNLAERSNFESIKQLVAAQANARNTLLYASDNTAPVSHATIEGLSSRQIRAISLLILSIMIWQSKKDLALVRHSVLAFLGIMAKLPEES